MNYQTFLRAKSIVDVATGIQGEPDINPKLFPFQQAITRWALKRGRASIFADCGLGKSPMQLEWARHIPGRVLIVAPLAVGPQTELEGRKFGIPATYMRQDDGKTQIAITNYEMLEHFSPDQFAGVVLDESSILKNYAGKFRNFVIETWGNVPFRLCCTATPAPNDYMELGNHAEFMGVMSRTEMLSMFFVHDGSETQQWRLKGHAQSDFWKWMCSWAVNIRKPSDIGFEDNGFALPACHMHDVIVEDVDITRDMLFPLQASTLQERLDARRRTIPQRCKAAADLINSRPDEPWLVWCNLNDESDTLASLIPSAVEVRGSDDQDEKEDRLLGFASGKYPKLISKPSIAGFGMNFQGCWNEVFVGLSDSYEQFYQALRRCWRFGQTHEVNAYIVTANTEGAVTANIRRKEHDSMKMADEMVSHMASISTSELHHTTRQHTAYLPKKTIKLPSFITA